MRRGLHLTTALLIATSLGTAQTTCSRDQTAGQIDARIDALIAQMTVPERIAQLQDRAPAIPRLHLPAYNWWNEGLHGLARDGYATLFPQAIGLAATWDPDLLHAVGDTVSTEARAKYNGHGHADTPRYGGLTIWSPNINIFRDPRWGRGQETYGEDPFLTATLGKQFVQGLQGNDPFYLKANATPKHFAAHSGPEKGRDSFNAVVSEHDLADTYLQAFHALTTDAHAAALMCSYNAINGTPSCGNDITLKQDLRERWGFAGYVVSDCDAVGDITDYHHFTADSAHGAALALNAGTDLDCGDTYGKLQRSFDTGLITEATLNRALHRLLAARVRLGMLDPFGCTPYDNIGPADIDSPEHSALALRAARESLVLLRNDGTLPLTPGKRIAVIGPTADSLKILEANYHGTAAHPITPLDGLRATYSQLTYAQGSLLAEGVSAPIPRTALQTGSEPNAAAGLTAEYFNRPSLTGEPDVKEQVNRVEYDLDRVGPSSRITARQYAARWTGYLRPPAPGDYTLRVNVERCWDCTTHDSYRLFVDGKLVLDNHGAKTDPDHTALHLTDTAAHALRLELVHTGEDEGIALEWLPPTSALLAEAKAAARSADAIVAFVGLSPDLEGEALQVQLPGFDSGDRTSLDLPEAQQQLLQALAATGKPLTVVLTSGSAVSLGEHAPQPAAMLEAWYPGQAGGQAIADILSGNANPSGRLPVTFYRSVADLPAFTDYSMAHRTYRYFDGPVLYPFGYGLSYSHFTYSAVHLDHAHPHAGEPITATITVRNDGKAAGSDVAELYLEPPQLPGAPRLTLQGMQRVELAPGESRELTFRLTPAQISTVDTAGKRSVRAGNYGLFIGSTQPDLHTGTGATFSITAEQPILP